MTDQDAYRRYTTEAEKALTRAAGDMSTQERFSRVALGNAWATLALAAAQERVQPADRPTDDQPARVKDSEGDIWYRWTNGQYAMEPEQAVGVYGPTFLTLEEVARANGGYTEVV